MQGSCSENRRERAQSLFLHAILSQLMSLKGMYNVVPMTLLTCDVISF